MPSPSSRTQPRGYETGPGPLHYKLRAKTVDTDILGMVFLADGTEAPVYLEKCGRRMAVVPEIARQGWVRTIYQYQVGVQGSISISINASAGTRMVDATGFGEEERQVWGGGETLGFGLEWGWSRGLDLGDERRVW